MEIDFTQAYDVYQNGNYPFETYVTTLSNYDGITPSTDFGATDGGGDGGQYILRNYLRYQKRPINQILDPYAQKNDYNNIIKYYNYGDATNLDGLSNYSYITDISATDTNVYDFYSTLQPLYVDASTATSISLNMSALRQLYHTPSEFNLFYLQDPSEDNDNEAYGYLLYPTKIFLNPIKLERNPTTGYWKLTTTTNITNFSAVYIHSYSMDKEAFYVHNNIYRNVLPSISNIGSITSPTNYYLNYDLKISNTIIDLPVIKFPSKAKTKYTANLAATLKYNTKVTPAIAYHVNPDSIVFTYSGYYVDPLDATNLITVKQGLPDIWNSNPSDSDSFDTNAGFFQTGRYEFFNPSYILNYNNNWYTKTKSETQTYQLIQYQVIQPIASNTKVLGDISNCLSKAIIDLNTTAITYTQPYVGKVRTYPSSTLNFSGIIDMDQTAYALANKRRDFALATLNSFKINASENITNIRTPTPNNTKGRWLNLNHKFQIADVDGKNIIWETKYPPHFYSYKVSLSSNSFRLYSPTYQNYADHFDLNFYLKTKLVNANNISNGSNFALLSSYIASDYNALTYDLKSVTRYTGDQIKYNLIDVDFDTLPNLSAAYGPNYDIPYPITINYNKYGEILSYSTGYVPASSGKDFKIDYINSPFGEAQFSIRPTILSLSAGRLDALDAIHITLAKNKDQYDTSTLFLDTLNEDSNTITLDSSFNITEDTWPSRDLTDSLISWNFTPSDTPNVTINAVDVNGNYIQTIEPNLPVDFSDQTWTVNVSGFGPNSISVYLSSQKYDQITDVISTNPSLFNYFSEKTIVVGANSILDNLNKTRTIQLTARVPFQGILYDIPVGTPISWTWQYDSETNPDNQPITINLPLSSNSLYDYVQTLDSTLLSSIQVNVVPITTYLNRPSFHQIKIVANTDVTFPTISGEYDFYLDDFPPSELLNADFKTYYRNYIYDSNALIADTREITNVITRPVNSDLYFRFVPYNDLDTTSIIKYNRKYWSIQGSEYSTNFAIDVDLNNITPTKLTPTVSCINITYNIDSALIKGWKVPHNVSSSTTVYLIDQQEFNKPLNFITYPEYAWLSDKKLTFLNTNNYTQSYAPSAYSNKKSSSQTFWLSANKDYFTKYNYQNGSEYSVSKASSNLELLDIPYINNDSIISTSGLSISLTAYNDTYYTEDNGLTFIMPVNGILTTKNFNITAKTIPFSNSLPSNKFLLSPLILPYDNLNLTFSVQNVSLNLDLNKNIIITQNITPVNNNSPAVIVGGTVNYFLSSYYWTVSTAVPAVNGTYNAFTLNIGDPLVPLYSGDLGVDQFYIYATSSIVQQISSNTFDNYSDYTGNKNLWEAIIV
jgi:hypothetical protein